jgi:hypothetical protein
VHCPEKVKVWPGSKFICEGTFNGQPYWWEIEQQDDTGRAIITPKDARCRTGRPQRGPPGLSTLGAE